MIYTKNAFKFGILISLLNIASSFATTWDSCYFSIPAQGVQIYLDSNFYASHAENFGVRVHSEGAPERSYRKDVTFEEGEGTFIYLDRENEFSLTVSAGDCERLPHAYSCAAQLTLSSVGSGTVADGVCEIQHDYTPPRPPNCSFGHSCH